MDQAVIHFGKYENKSLRWIAENDGQYLLWLASLPRLRENRELWPTLRRLVIEHLQQDAGLLCDLA
jgi:hypothetical protein